MGIEWVINVITVVSLLFKHLGEALNDAYVMDMLPLTMYYYFMSYLALTYAQSIRVGLALIQARITVVLQLQARFNSLISLIIRISSGLWLS
jgi:hypothetical protein